MRYLLLIAVAAGLAFGQSYRCDWSVVGIGGGEMSGTAYKCGSTAGQTAAGLVTASNYWALVGYWLPEGQVGLQEEPRSPGGQAPETRLYAPTPNPARAAAAIRYSLAAFAHASLSVHDLAGRSVRVLVNSEQKPGRYAVRWDGTDGFGRMLPNGVYFFRFAAGAHQQTQKLLLTR